MQSIYKPLVWLVLISFLGSLLLANTVISQDTAEGDKILEKFQEEPVPVEPLIPADVTVHERFKHGEGDVVGTVEVTQGDVYVIHANQKDAYRLSKNQPLYLGDTVITKADSTINAIMNDRSVFALAANAKFAIEKVDYDVQTNKRDSLVRVLWGRARVIVENLGSDKDDYIIKTPTATCGVRGSDIGILVGPEKPQQTSWWKRAWKRIGFPREAHAQAPTTILKETVIVAGEKTELVVQGVVGPSKTLTSFTVSVAGATIEVTLPVAASVASVTAALSAIAPTLAALDMPPHME